MSCQFLYFDLGNVLVTFNYALACRNVASLTGLTADQVRSTLFDAGLQQRYELGQLTSDQFHQEFCQATGTRPDREALMQAVSDMFELNVPVVPIVAQLRAAGYALGILSNTCDAHWREISLGRFTLIRKYFQEYVLSYEAGCAKPDSQIFDLAIQRAGCPAEGILFVDDQPENVAAAARVGLDALPFESASQLTRELLCRGLRANL